MFSKQHLPIILKLIGLLSIVVVGGISMFGLAGAAVMFTATKTDTLVIDNDHDGIVDPGDTLEYTVVVQNTGDQTATNVNFSDTLDANTTLTGPVHVSPLAFKDSYTSLGNVGITVNAANGVLANDIDPDSNVSLSVTANAGGTTQGGTFAIAADGSFSYRPPTGFEGIDTFSYTLSDGDSITPNDTETVTITVNEVIWFIDNSATGPGAGQLSDPFNSIANFNNLAADEAGDIIFIYETGSGVYTGDIALLSNQTVIGQGASASIAAITGITVPPFSNAIPSTGGSRPVLGNSFVGVRIQANNTLSGFDIGNTPFGGAGIANLPQNVSFGALTISDMAIGGAGRAILLLGDGTLDVTLDSVNSSADVNGLGFLGTTGVIDGKFTVTGATTIDDTDNIGINIFNSSATYDFGNTSITNVGVNQAVNITSSPSGSFTFDALTITTDNGPGLFANGGAVNVTGSANTINATNGPAVSLTNTTIGTSGITFRSVSANNAANGIVLNNTGSGSFSVTGVGATAGSGGTIQNISGSGVNLISAQNVSLANMNLTNTAQSPAVATGSATCDDEDSGTNTGCNAAVYMHNTTNTTLVGLIINDSNQHGLNGNNVNGLTVQNTTVDNIGDGSLENGLAFINLLGSVVFSNLDVNGSATRNALIENNTGTANITVNNGSSFNNTTLGALGEDGFHFVASGNANATLTIEASNFIQNDAAQLKVHAEENSIVTVTIDDNAIEGDPNEVGNSGIDLAVRDSAQLNYVVTNNTLQPIRIHGINLFAFGGGSANGRINGNTIDETNQGSAIRVVAEVTTSSNPSIITEINNNIISNSGGGGLLGALHLEARTGASTGVANIQATVDNNSVALNAGSSDNAGAHYEIYNSDGHTVCANFTNNAASGTASFGDTFYIGNPVSGSGLGAGTVQLQGFTSNVQTTWTNNGNAGTTFNEGTNPVAGICSAVAAMPSTIELAQADEAAPAGESLAALTTLVEPLDDSRQSMAESHQRTVDSGQSVAQDDSFTTKDSQLPIHNFSSKPAGLASPLRVGETIPVNIGDMEAGQSVTIIYRATINPPPTPLSNDQVCNQGTVTAAGGINVLTDDPDLGGGADPTCTVVDVPTAGSLTLVKEAEPADGTDFAFNSNILGGNNFTLDDEPSQTDTISQSITFTHISVGSYVITETLPGDWVLTGATCTGGSDSGSLSGETLTVSLGEGEDVVCTFTNGFNPAPDSSFIYLPFIVKD